MIDIFAMLDSYFLLLIPSSKSLDHELVTTESHGDDWDPPW